ncbi:MAG: pyridoxamine 5'-phosphate oxidase family protein [Promethearchaeota archaeon]
MAQKITFDYLEKQLRKKSFGLLGTVSPKGWSQTTGVSYAVSLPELPLYIWVITGKTSKKYKNIRSSPQVSFAVPYPHHIFRFIPAGVIQFQGKAEIFPFDNQVGLHAFNQTRILRFNLRMAEEQRDEAEPIFIRIRPHKRLSCQLIGNNIIELARNPESGLIQVPIPKDR